MICNAISCLLCKLKTITAIVMKFHTVLKPNKMMCHTQEPYSSALHIFGVISLWSFAMLFHVVL